MSKLTRMAIDLLIINEDLPHKLDYNQNIKPTVDDFELHTFEQVWGSTALGFGGIGGQSMTTARTYVLVPLIDGQKCHVYFDGKYAYAADYGEKIIEDIRKQSMVSVSMSGKYKISKATPKGGA